MLDYNLIGLLAQGGFVGIFVAYVIITRGQDRKDQAEREKVWQDIIKLNQNEFLASLRELSAAIRSETDTLLRHDAKTDAAVAKMDERTRPGRKPRPQ